MNARKVFPVKTSSTCCKAMCPWAAAAQQGDVKGHSCPDRCVLACPRFYTLGKCAEAHQVDERNAVLLQRGNMTWQVAPRQNAAMYTRVQRLHTTYAPTTFVLVTCSAGLGCPKRDSEGHIAASTDTCLVNTLCREQRAHAEQAGTPSSISGKPVSSSTRRTGTPAASTAAALPPVDTIS